MNQNLSSFNTYYLHLSFSSGVNTVYIFTFVPKSYHVTIPTTIDCPLLYKITLSGTSLNKDLKL